MSSTEGDLVALLPHRPPMRFLDAAEMRDDGRLLSRQTIPVSDQFLDGHFPGFPMWPGALLIEAMAQTTAVWLLCGRGGLAPDEVPMLGAVDCQFRRPVRPGSVVVFETRRIHDVKGLGLFAVTATTADGAVIARARISACIKPRSAVCAAGD
jgi:3-hydroxyacyl-[acyl-carrier-protein] dehydratase